MIKKLLVFTGLLISIVGFAQQQAPRFEKEVKAFDSINAMAMPAPNQVLLIGSSSFTYWKDVAAYFPKHKIVNRAFGGSTLEDLWYHRQKIVDPYRPKQIIIYCGENDFASSDTVSVATVVQRFQTLFTYIRQQYPKVWIAYVSMKPSPSRRHLLPKFQLANQQIRQFLTTHKRTAFVDVYTPMMQPNLQPISGIFTSDSLHMNADGYRIWQLQLKPVIKK